MSIHNLTIKPNAETLSIEELHLSKENKKGLSQLLDEFKYFDALKEWNLPIDNKILLHGATGCGKTATAHAIAKELGKKIISLNLGNFVSSRLGETARNVNSVFRTARLEKAVLFIDEFDFLGKSRDYDDKDNGEMKRLVNSLIQQIDSIDNNCILVCATNYVEVIDHAILRRFQLKMEYHLPTQEQLNNYYNTILKQYPSELLSFDRKYNISYAEAKDYVITQVKNTIIHRAKNSTELLFSYGTLQLDSVQQDTYGRKLTGKKATLSGYKMEQLQITDAKVLATSNQEYHPIAVQTGDSTDKIDGMIFEITREELFNTDKYEVDDYKRVLETFDSGDKAWIYIKK